MYTLFNNVVQFPPLAVAQMGYAGGSDFRFLAAPPNPTQFSASIAAGATSTLIAAALNVVQNVVKILFSVDAGGPFLFTIGTGKTLRLRNAVPFFVTLDFGPVGIEATENSAITLKNEHGATAANCEVWVFNFGEPR